MNGRINAGINAGINPGISARRKQFQYKMANKNPEHISKSATERTAGPSESFSTNPAASPRLMYKRLLDWLMPSSLPGRLSVVMVIGVLLTQLASNAFWSAQMRKESEIETKASSQHLADSAARTIRYFLGLPPKYRPLVIQQFREMGGTRFFVSLTNAPLVMKDIPGVFLTDLAKQQIMGTLKNNLGKMPAMRIDFCWPEDMVLSKDGSGINDVPDSWVQHILVTKPNPAPILVIQVELEPDRWLYLASLMPNPYFLESHDPLTLDRILLQFITLAAVLLLSIIVVRWITRPLASLSEAAEAFGKGEGMPMLPETGSREIVNTARTFSVMRERIGRYILDRERLFVSISHDLRTPIMRLKLRAELLDDEHIRSEFHEDLDELDMMVKGALQCVKDSDIYENPTCIWLDTLLSRMVRSARLSGHEVTLIESGLSVQTKPLALKRAIGNLLDNALFYGEQVVITVNQTAPVPAHSDSAPEKQGEHIEIHIRDHGPGIPEEALHNLFDPYVRLEHGRNNNINGLGLGLGISRDIVHALGGQLVLSNHPQGGLEAVVVLPSGTTPQDILVAVA